MRIVVIGGGASGLVAAISAKRYDNEVIILERNNVCGKKILITGAGRCNYFNDDFSVGHYRSSNLDKLSYIINENYKKRVLDFFDDIGIMPKVRNGYYYPNSNQAVTVREALVGEAIIRGVNIRYNALVKDVSCDGNGFVILVNDNERVTCDKVILATGSLVAPYTGSDGFAYRLLPKFNHTVVPVLPALCPIISDDDIYRDVSGVRTDAKICVIDEKMGVFESYGELQLIDNGISGICVFQLSDRVIRSVYENKDVLVRINFLPSLNFKDVGEVMVWLDEREVKLPFRSVSSLLDGVLNYKIVNWLLKLSKIDRDMFWGDIGDVKRESLCRSLIDFNVSVSSKYSFDKAQVVSGGISLAEVDIHTMESIRERNLYLVGELLDVNGDCGGYNLGFAWVSGIIAGESAKGDV